MSDTDTTHDNADDATDKDATDDTTTTTDTAKDTDTTSDPAAEAAKWKALARKHEAQAKANADAARKLAEQEDAKKSDLQKATDKVTAAEQRATDAERKALQLEVALEKAPEGMPIVQVRKLAKRLAGGTREEFEADADELFADFAPSDKDDDTRRRPRERLKAGAAPSSEPEEKDPEKLAAQVSRGW